MPAFSGASLANLATCDERLQRVFREVVKHFDCQVLEGHRSAERQLEMHALGRSKIKAGGKHNASPSLAVDVAPFPVNWDDTQRFHYFAGFVKGVAAQLGVNLRWGGDWDSDTEVKDETFRDLPHFEIAA
jgi:peptidoglycan LD-endopeptidase CwlK